MGRDCACTIAEQKCRPVQPIDVKSLSVAAIICSSDSSTATIIGSASVNGSGSHEYELDVKDGGEPAYNSGTHNLLGGNIQIH